MSFPASIPTGVLTSKATMGFALAALAVAGAGGVTISSTAAAGHASGAAVSTTTPDTHTSTNQPSSAFGSQVVARVNACKGLAPSNGKQGIGTCVSSWVVSHNPGSQQRNAATTNHTAGR